MTQNEKILAALRDGKRISPLSALQDYGCMRLAARIYDLRDQGWDISPFQQPMARPHGWNIKWPRTLPHPRPVFKQIGGQFDD